MWKNEVTDEVFETWEEAEESIIEELDDYLDELYHILSECDEMWIFDHLNPKTQEEILDQWIERASEKWLFELDDE